MPGKLSPQCPSLMAGTLEPGPVPGCQAGGPAMVHCEPQREGP